MIKVQNLRKTYNEKVVLNNISFTVDRNTICGLMGKNGAGKSTLLKILFADLNFEGHVYINDLSPTDFKKSHFSETFFLNDSPHIYDYLTPLEYIQFVLESKKIAFLPKKEKLYQLASVFDMELSLKNLIKTFSFGMKRKVQLLSIALLAPKFLILDEPTLGLDATSVVIFKKVLSYMAKAGSTVILSSHEPDFLNSICDQLLILHNSQLAYSNKLLKNPTIDINSVYLNIIDAQMSETIQSLFES